MERGIKPLIRELVDSFGEFDGINIHKTFTYPKRLIKLINKNNFEENDKEVILEYIENKTELIDLNKKDQCDSVFSKMYFRVNRAHYRMYKLEMYEYMYEYLDLYMVNDIEKFIKKSRKILRG